MEPRMTAREWIIIMLLVFKRYEISRKYYVVSNKK